MAIKLGHPNHEVSAMCGRFYVPEDDSVQMLRAIFEELEHRNVKVKTGEVTPGCVAAVIASNRKLERQPFAMEWGYHLPNGKLIFNTRSETAAEKPLFADGIRQRRCLIPAAHYFEWERTASGKTKYAIAPKEGEGFFLAGIYRMEAGKPVFSILTRSPSKDIAFIHDRMPVILPNEATNDWLNPRFNGAEILQYARTEMNYSAC